MRNLTKNQLKKAIFMRLSDFEDVVEKAIPDVKVSYCEEALFYDAEPDRTVEKDEIYEALSEYFDVYVTSIHTDGYEDVGVWIVYQDKTVSAEVPCAKCYNARFDSELTDENDFSSYTIGCVDEGFRMMYSTGYGKRPRIEFDKWSEENKQWLTVGKYFPRHCPECGREITEYPEVKNG